MKSTKGSRAIGIVLSVAFLAGLASPAMAASAPSARLVSHQARDCLLVSGQRDNAASAVRINGHIVQAEGKRHWRVHLPVETIRQWSAPFARSIEVTVVDPETRGETTARAALPIGLLGHVENLAMLVVSVK